MRVLDLFCGRLGWGKAFAARGHEVIGVDMVAPPEIPQGCTFIQADIMGLRWHPGLTWGRNRKPKPCFELYGGPNGYEVLGQFDFICASSPCEQFSVHGMKHFHPNAKHPELGIRLFEHTRAICEASGVPYIMENVRPAQKFIGRSEHHCGPFYLWGTGVPPLMPQGIRKGLVLGGGGAVLKMIANGATRADIRAYRQKHDAHWNSSGSAARKKSTAEFATIPPELAACVCDYAERILVTELQTPIENRNEER